MKTVPRIPGKALLVLATAGAAVAVAAAPVAAQAPGPSTGGASPTPSPTGGVQYGTPVGEVGGPALHGRSAGLLGHTLRFAGTAAAGQTVVIQRLDPHLGAWLTETTARADGQGAYLARWKADHIGVISLRAMTHADGTAHASQAAPAVQVTIYKPALATWYGPGFYGHRTACGVRLTHALVGVAHRGLPCGRTVALYYRGRTITAPVVDRGPYGASGASWDLTQAAAQALGFDATDRIGAVSLPGR
jgi:hypothetical protein